jgi:hypothetical protein
MQQDGEIKRFQICPVQILPEISAAGMSAPKIRNVY